MSANQAVICFETAKDSLRKIIDLFGNTDRVKDLPKYCSRAFIDSPMKPSSKWSMGNRIIMLLNGTEDARGFRQWQEVKRYVKRGCRAIYILAPLTKGIQREKTVIDKETGEERPTGEYETVEMLIGFKDIPVFRIEDTDGETLKPYVPKTIPPLAEVALKWGYTVRYERLPGELGHLSPDKKEIVLGTEGAQVFLHELSHVAQNKLGWIHDKTPLDLLEASAELASATLAHLYSLPLDQFSWDYIARYANATKPEQVARMCIKVASMVEEMLKTILPEGREGEGV